MALTTVAPETNALSPKHQSSQVLDASAAKASLPYTPGQQVELLHLQAELDALLVELQALQQQRQGI
ncbi:MAG: hypothetical protein IGR92_16710 [Leptolyngbyaceae cyanobacterium T60_A2020_046]|nr:hypothetical protein [Leptolyngbyaceae cyanobacterium T60_A2020_046]